MDEPPKKLSISMLSSSEEFSYLEWEDELMAADSYEGDNDGDDKDVGSSSKRRRKSVSPAKTQEKDVGSSSKKSLSPAKTQEKDVGSSSKKSVNGAKTNPDGKEKDVGRRRKKSVLSPAKTNEDDKEKDIGRKKIVCRANPDDYPQLASFLRQNHMEEELQRNWTVLQQKWIKIMDIAAVKFDLLQDIFDVINPQANLFLSDFH